MEKLSKLMSDYLNTWQECSICNDMVKLKYINGTNEDNPICIDCLYEESIL
mgnify:CR=1 FL=1